MTAGTGRLGRSFDLWETPGGRTLEDGELQPRTKLLMAAIHGGLCQFPANVEELLGFTPCALKELPHHGKQEQSQKKK